MTRKTVVIFCSFLILFLIKIATAQASNFIPVFGYVTNNGNCNSKLNSTARADAFCSLGELTSAVEKLNISNAVYDVQINLIGNSAVVFPVDGMSSCCRNMYRQMTVTGMCSGGNCVLQCTLLGRTAFNVTNANFGVTIANVNITQCDAALALTWDPSIAPALNLELDNVAITSCRNAIVAKPLASVTVAYSSQITLRNAELSYNFGASQLVAQNVSIDGSRFSTNTVGALEIHLLNGNVQDHPSLAISQSTFSNNLIADAGGALKVLIENPNSGSQALVEIVSSVFNSNGATSTGGAIYMNITTDTLFNLTGTTFVNNIAASDHGGAMFISTLTGKMSNVVIDDCSIANNKAGNAGGAIWYQGGTASSLAMTSVSFQQNYNILDQGAAVYLNTLATVTMISNVFTQNFTPYSVIYLYNVAVGTMSNSTVSYNYGALSGIVSVFSDMAPSTLTITDSTLNSNIGLSAAVFANGSMASISIFKSFLWGNSYSALSCNTGAEINASAPNSIHSNGFLGRADSICSSCSILLPEGQDGCALCIFGRDVCSICNGASACLTPGCPVPYTSCSDPTLANDQSSIAIKYDGVDPTLQSKANNTDLVSLTMYSLTDLPTSGPSTTYVLQDAIFLKNNIVTVLDTTLITFDAVLSNLAVVSTQQTLFGGSQDIAYANNSFTVSENTLKISLFLANWPNNNTVRLQINVQNKNNATVQSVKSSSRQSIIEDLSIRSGNIVTTLALSNVFVSTDNQGKRINVPAKISYKKVANSVQVFVDFQGPVRALNYDPDISALIDTGGDGDGGDDSTLIAILVPVLVGSACLCVCCIIILAIIIFVGIGIYQKRQGGINLEDSVTL